MRDLFGESLAQAPLQPDTTRKLFLPIGASSTVLSAHGTELYAKSAYALADAVFSNAERRQRPLMCDPQQADDECSRQFIERFGRRVYRRLLTNEEIERWTSVAAGTSEGNPL